MLPENAARIGLEAQPGVVPREQTARFFIGKGDYQLAQNHRLTGRTIIFRNDSPNNIAGGLTTIERTTDFLDAMESTSGQLVSTFGSQMLNEFRVQYARRVQSRGGNDLSGTGPAVNIPGIANFGGPIATTADAGFGFTQGIFQVVEQLQLRSRQPQLQVRRRHPVDRRHAHLHAAAAVHVPEHRRLPGRQERHQSAQLHELPAADRQPRLHDEVVGLQLLRAGRLARVAEPEVHLRPALRLLQLPGRRPQRAVPLLAGLCRRRQQRRSALRPCLHVRRRQAPGHSRQLRHHVRPDAARGLRDRHPGQRQPRTHQRDAGRLGRQRAGIPRLACRPAPGLHAAAPVDHHRRPRLPGRAHLAEQRPVRARLRPELLRVGRLHVRAGRPAAGDRQHQPDQPRRANWPTAGRSSARRSTPTRASIPASTRSTSCSRRATRRTTR